MSRLGLDALLHRHRPGPLQRCLDYPCMFLARKFYSLRPSPPQKPIEKPVSVVCVCDTHNSQPSLPNGDILIHAGNLTQGGTLQELQGAISWLCAEPHPIKIVIAGNHDVLLDPDYGGHLTCPNGRQLCIYGSPRTPRYGNWAFQYTRNDDIWTGTIPKGVDILVTHGPPRSHLDLGRLGCYHLLRELWRVRPKIAPKHFLLFLVFRRTVTTTTCTLVNAAMVGGLRDDERRQARVVTI
ncbi:putative rhamnogalacturonate lyase C [Podospora australis]|uniref:Rhamnogalacturonate lyase C n=1 Tax=Podospora australis TaxID=1536484 RepID=A0AAN7ACG9_9PEZI|nr:putative rhamnogalacturonate lyase C [Podospora australis]